MNMTRNERGVDFVDIDNRNFVDEVMKDSSGQDVDEREIAEKTETVKEKDQVLRTAVILAVIVFVVGVIIVAVRLSNPQKDTTKGTKILAAMDQADVSKVNKKIKKLEDEERKAQQEADDRPASEKFADTLVIGDSITQGLYQYGVLDQANVQADRGTGVSDGDNDKLAEHIAKAKEMKPSALFLAYGMNDIGTLNGDADSFVKAYKTVIKDLKKALPDTKIYVNSVLPAAQSAIDQNAVYEKVPEFNEKLKKLCEKEDVTFIDNTDLVKQEYYASDGIHMSPAYYKEWVNHMAEVAEL